MAKLGSTRLSDEALADCFGRLDREKASLDAMRPMVREEVLLHHLKSLIGQFCGISVSSLNNSRWNSDALSIEVGARAEFLNITLQRLTFALGQKITGKTGSVGASLIGSIR